MAKMRKDWNFLGLERNEKVLVLCRMFHLLLPVFLKKKSCSKCNNFDFAFFQLVRRCLDHVSQSGMTNGYVLSSLHTCIIEADSHVLSVF